jgi:hypothetical protein
VAVLRPYQVAAAQTPPEILEALRFGRIEWTKAKEIAKLESEAERGHFWKKRVFVLWPCASVLG